MCRTSLREPDPSFNSPLPARYLGTSSPGGCRMIGPIAMFRMDRFQFTRGAFAFQLPRRVVRSNRCNWTFPTYRAEP